MNKEHRPESFSPFRCGYVSLSGRPNVGKSTLLNTLVGQHLSIISPKAQTTRERVAGILTGDDYQILFIDAPGLLEPRYALQEAMLLAAGRAIEDADVVAYIVDPTQRDTLPEPTSSELNAVSVPVLVLINKCDLLDPGEVREWCTRSEAAGYQTLAISAATGVGVDDFVARAVSLLPESPPLFPVDETATEPLRFFAAELVRETCTELFREEIPYSIACEVEEFREDREPVFIRVIIYVERDSQKGIVIGRGGSAIRQLGERSRRKIEELLDQKVYLELRVKVMPNWSRRRGQLQRLGFKLPRGKG